MRKIRNPRYAPEFLERKLSPSSMVHLMPPVQVLTYDAPGYPPPNPTDPPDPTDPTDPATPPGIPGGPTLPS